jgi:hypothetical protein
MVPIELASGFKVTRAYKDFSKRFGPGSEAAIAFDIVAAPLKNPFSTPFTLIAEPDHRLTRYLVATIRPSSVNAVEMQVHFGKKEP